MREGQNEGGGDRESRCRGRSAEASLRRLCESSSPNGVTEGGTKGVEGCQGPRVMVIMGLDLGSHWNLLSRRVIRSDLYICFKPNNFEEKLPSRAVRRSRGPYAEANVRSQPQALGASTGRRGVSHEGGC